MFDLCSDRLKAGLKVNRDRAEREAEEYFAKKFNSTGGDAGGAMEEDAKPSGDDPVAAPAPVSTDAMEEAPSATEDTAEANAVTNDFDFGEGIPPAFRGLYELMGVVTHKGRSADSGHYIGWVRKEAGSGQWWKYDDDKVSEATTADVLNLKGGGDWHTAYLNFYRFKE